MSDLEIQAGYATAAGMPYGGDNFSDLDPIATVFV